MLTTNLARWPGRTALAAALIALAVPAAAPAQFPEPPKPGDRPGAPPAAPRPAAEGLREQALRARLFRAMNGPGPFEEAPPPPVDVARPSRKVTTPTLTSEQIDELVDRVVAEAGGTPAPVADDATFLRRACLDLTGVPPTPEQVESFLAGRDPEKRPKLIDRLLASDAYATRWARYWRDVVRYKATFENPRLVNYQALESWLAEQFAANRPWDEIATDLIAGTGKTSETGNVVFAIAHLDGRRGVSPPEFAGEVSRIFLGVQLQCAQCHDHPTDPWTREQFHEFAAFFGDTIARRNGRPMDPDYEIEIVANDRRARYAMPDLEDPTNQVRVEPAFFLDGLAWAREVPAGLSGQQRRELAASFVTGQDNPWFARAFVNRAWYELTGEAFYLPVDDLGPTRDPVAPEVIDALADQWAAGGYDIAWLFRTIMNTEAYQRASASGDSSAASTRFAANCPGRLSSDQIVDALDRALGLFSYAARVAPPPENAMQAMRRARFGPRFFVDQLFGVDPSTPGDEVLGTIPQALFLMNAQGLERGIQAPRGTVAAILSAHPDDREALDALYLRALARTPNDEEARVCLDYVGSVGDRREAFEDLMWALINSTEFISRR